MDWLNNDEKLVAHFLKRYKKAKSTADLWASIMEACYHYAIPFRNRFYRPNEEQGEQKNTRLYDTTAVEATKTFVSKLHNAMTPPQVQWGFLEISEELVDEDDKVKEQAQLILDSYMRRLFGFIHQSNFDVIINECYFDLAVGTSCLVVNMWRDDNPLLFTSIPLDKLAIEESIDGRVHSWYRTWENIRIAEIKHKWKNARLTAELQQKLNENPEATVAKVYEGVMFVPDKKKTPYCYMVCFGEDYLLKDWLESNPGIVWRFQKINSETWGRGPIMDALPSIASLNEMARIELASANLNTFKPYMAFSDAVFNPHTFKLEPFSIIPIAPIGSQGQPPLIPLGESSNPQFAQLTIQDLRNQIKALLFNEASQSPSIQPGSATEVMVNQQDLAQKIGPLFSRLQQEFLWPVIERCSYILDKMGILEKPKIDGKMIQFAYRSPLAQSRGQQEMAKFTQFMQLAQGMYGPDITQLYINPKTALYKIAEYIQLDPELLNSPDAVEQASQQMAAMAQAQQEAEAEQGQQPPPQQQ